MPHTRPLRTSKAVHDQDQIRLNVDCAVKFGDDFDMFEGSFVVHLGRGYSGEVRGRQKTGSDRENHPYEEGSCAEWRSISYGRTAWPIVYDSPVRSCTVRFSLLSEAGMISCRFANHRLSSTVAQNSQIRTAFYVSV